MRKGDLGASEVMPPEGGLAAMKRMPWRLVAAICLFTLGGALPLSPGSFRPLTPSPEAGEALAPDQPDLIHSLELESPESSSKFKCLAQPTGTYSNGRCKGAPVDC